MTDIVRINLKPQDWTLEKVKLVVYIVNQSPHRRDVSVKEIRGKIGHREVVIDRPTRVAAFLISRYAQEAFRARSTKAPSTSFRNPSIYTLEDRDIHAGIDRYQRKRAASTHACCLIL